MSTKFANFIFENFEKQIASCESIGRELSFEWSHHRISSIDSKVSRVTSQNSIKHPGSERVNKDLETREMSYGTCESAKEIELDRDKRLNWGGGGGGGEGEGRVMETNHEAKRV